MAWDRIADVGRWVWVGSQLSCDMRGAEFDRRIHIQYPGVACPCRNQGPDDLCFELIEKRPLGTELLDRIAEFARKPGRRLFIHCHGGVCRGPTTAVVALIARGARIGEAMGLVADGMWSQYRAEPFAPEFFAEPLNEIWRWSKGLRSAA